MPNVNIREIDNTKSNASLENKHIVLISGPATESNFEEEYISTVSRLEAVCEDEDRTTHYFIAKECIENGLIVLYVKEDTVNHSFDEKYKSRMAYPGIEFIIPQAETTSSSKASVKNAVEIAATRGDCIALVDISVANEKATTGSTPKTAVENIQAEIDGYNNVFDTVTRTSINGAWEDGEPETTEEAINYVKFFAPHFTSDAYPNITLPASLGFLTAFAKSTVENNNKPWMAIAGDRRGLINVSGKVTLNVVYTEADIANLQPRDTLGTEENPGHAACNVIVDSPTGGIEVYGDRTGCKANELVASSFGNIRVISNMIKKRMFEAGNVYRWEPNSDLMWTNFTDYVNVVLKDMQGNQGIRGFKWEKFVASKKALIRCKLTIIPIEPVEDFDITLELSNEL